MDTETAEMFLANRQVQYCKVLRGRYRALGETWEAPPCSFVIAFARNLSSPTI